MAIAGVVCFSLRPILIKLAYGYVVDPVTLLALRMVFSLPFFLAAAAWVGRDATRDRLTRRDVWAIVFLGFIGYYFASFVDFLGLQYVSAGLGRLILFLYPTLVVVLSIIFLHKRPGIREIVALGITYSGVALVMSTLLGDGNANLALGAALCFASAAGYAVYLVAGSQVVQRVGSVRFTAYATTVASIFCIAQFFLLRPLSALALPPPVYGLAIAMAIFSTVLPVFITSEALRRIGANQVALIGALGPVTTIFFGWMGLDETMTPVQLAGARLGVGGARLGARRAAREFLRRSIVDLKIRGKAALVCGASKGLGRGCATSLAREGCRVTLVARERQALEKTADEIRAGTGATVVTVAADITSEQGRIAALAACPEPDILVTNARGPPPGDFRKFSREDWQKALGANMLTPIELIKATVDGMIARRFGRIINITSSAVKAPIAELALSNGARSGLTGFVAGLARKTVAHNVTINNLLPGRFWTDRLISNTEFAAKEQGRTPEEIKLEREKEIPAGRFGTPDDVA